MSLFKYDVVDEAVIESEAETVYKAIIDLYDGRANWWMPHVSSRLVQGHSSEEVGAVYKVMIHGRFPISFVTETIEAEPNKFLWVKYIRGAFEGEGLWEVEKVGEKTKIRFRWRTNPSIIRLKLLDLFYPVARTHSRVMRKGFKGLAVFCGPEKKD